MAMCHRLCGLSTYGLKAHVKEISTPPKLTFGHGPSLPFFTFVDQAQGLDLIRVSRQSARRPTQPFILSGSINEKQSYYQIRSTSLSWPHLVNACEVKAHLIGCWQNHGAVCFWQPIPSGLNLVVAAVLRDSLCVVSLLPCVADCCMLYVCKVDRFVLTIIKQRLLLGHIIHKPEVGCHHFLADYRYFPNRRESLPLRQDQIILFGKRGTWADHAKLELHKFMFNRIINCWKVIK